MSKPDGETTIVGLGADVRTNAEDDFETGGMCLLKEVPEAVTAGKVVSGCRSWWLGGMGRPEDVGFESVETGVEEGAED